MLFHCFMNYFLGIVNLNNFSPRIFLKKYVSRCMREILSTYTHRLQVHAVEMLFIIKLNQFSSFIFAKPNKFSISRASEKRKLMNKMKILFDSNFLDTKLRCKSMTPFFFLSLFFSFIFSVLEVIYKGRIIIYTTFRYTFSLKF